MFYPLQNSYIGFLDFKKEAIKKLGMRANTCSFNPGVFVANLTEWKQQNITSQLEFWMEHNAKLVSCFISCVVFCAILKTTSFIHKMLRTAVVCYKAKNQCLISVKILFSHGIRHLRPLEIQGC